MSQFISFTTKYSYDDDNKKIRVSAETQLNEWLKNNYVEIISWKPCTIEGQWHALKSDYEPALCIVVEYKNKEMRYHE